MIVAMRSAAQVSDRSRLRQIVPHLAGPSILLFITLAVFWKITLTQQYTWMNHPDAANQILPWFQFQASEWHSGRFPLWDPHHWGGQSLVGQDQPGVLYPVNWVLFLLPFRQGHISFAFLNYYFAFIHYMGALFCYWLCRYLGLSRTASVFGGVAFALDGYVGVLQWPQMLNGAVWVPLVLLFLLRAIRSGRVAVNAALSGAFLGVSLLSGHHQIPLFTALMVGGVLLYFAISGRCSVFRSVTLGAVMAAFTFLLSAPQLLPAFEYWSNALRWVSAQDPVRWRESVPYIVHANFSLNPVSILGIIFPDIHPNADPFVGIVVVVLALIAVATCWGYHEIRLFSGIALGGLIVSLGGDSIFHGLLYSVLPLVAKARFPAAAIFIFHFGLAILAAHGVDALRSARAATTLIRYLPIALWGLCAAVYLFLLGVALVQNQQVFVYRGIALTGLVCLLAGAAFFAWQRRSVSDNAAVVSLALIMLLELGHVTAHFPHREQGWNFLTKLEENGDIVEFLKMQDPSTRVAMDRNEIPFNFGDWYGVDQFDGYAGVTENIFRMSGENNTHVLLGEAFYIGRKPASPGEPLVFNGKSGLNVYRNPEAFPRVWTVHKSDEVRGSAEIPEIQKPLADLRAATFVHETVPVLEVCPGQDTTRQVERSSDFILLEAEMQCKGMVIVSDTYFPGWKATVDGNSTPVYETYGMIRGVVAERGRHRIEMRYRPLPVYLGCGLAMAGVALLALIAARSVTRLSL